MIRRRLAALACCLAAGCGAGADGGPALAPPDPAAFKQRWYAGQAELTRYELEQWRYRETHRGDAVLIFVTEDFLPETQVKYEHGTTAEKPLSVLKLNFTRKFVTGIYPYSTMTSVFTPVQGNARTLKVSASIQEWCGQTYEQLNLRADGYHGLLHSYFQDEADREFRLASAVPEDELWTRIRLDPRALPLGEVQLIPGLQFARLRHRPSRVERAAATLTDGGDGLALYRVTYRDIPRTLEIRFESAFPHGIVSWEERLDPGDGQAPQVTRARRTHSIMTDYWNRNSVGDEEWRRRLGLD